MKPYKLSYVLILTGLGLALGIANLRVHQWQRRKEDRLKYGGQNKIILPHDQEKPVREQMQDKEPTNVRQQASPGGIISPTEPHSEHPSHNSEDNKTPPCRASALCSSGNKFIRRLCKPITLFTGLLVVISVLQYRAFVASERASVVPIEVHFAKELIAGLHPLPIVVEMQNGGKSTATTDELAMAITHGPLPPEPEYYKTTPYTVTPILPNGTHKKVFSFDIGNTGWSEETRMGVKTGARKLYLYGYIRYQDEFSHSPWPFGTRETGFCFVYMPIGGVHDSVFETCPEPAYTYTK
jgi:hypothetical protein